MKILNKTRKMLSDERIRYLLSKGTSYRENEIKECYAYFDYGFIISFRTYEDNREHRLFYTRNEAFGSI